jgi:hypothetical protein
LQEEIVDETDNEPINARVLTMSLSPGMRRLLLASQQRQAQRMACFLPASPAGAAAAAGACFSHGDTCASLPSTTVTVVTTRASVEGSASHHAAAAAGAGASSSNGAPAGTVVTFVQAKQ